VGADFGAAGDVAKKAKEGRKLQEKQIVEITLIDGPGAHVKDVRRLPANLGLEAGTNGPAT